MSISKEWATILTVAHPQMEYLVSGITLAFLRSIIKLAYIHQIIYSLFVNLHC